MNNEQAKEIHLLLFTFIATFHEKILINFRKCADLQPRLKKNHAKVLHVLYRQDSLTPTELGKMLDIEKGGLTTIIDKLEDTGLLVRLADPNDRRKTLLSLSPEGKKYMENVIQKFRTTLMELFKDVDSKELDKYIENLRYITEFMQKIK